MNNLGIKNLLKVRVWPESARALAILAGAILLTLLPHVPHLPVWIPAVVVAVTLWRMWIEIHAQALPPRWLRLLLAALGMVAVFMSFRTLNGLEAGTALLAMMAGMKLLESRQLRDYTILIFIALFLLFAELLFEQELYLLPYLLLCTLLIVACLLRLHDGVPLPYRDAVRRSLRLLLQALPLAVLLFLFVPRLPGQFWIQPARGGATSGLSETMSPGDVSNLSLSSAVAFRAEFIGATPPSKERYWRAVVLHDFDGRTWRRTRNEMFTPQPIQAGPVSYRYRMLLEPNDQPWAPTLDVPLQSNLRRSLISSDLQLLTIMPLTKLTAYEASAATEYRYGSVLSSTLRRIDTRLEGALNPRSRELARQLRQASADDAQYIGKVLNLFREQAFYYTLQPPTLGTHSVDEFLFNTKRGFCEHFASAFTFLMRAAGVPARVVTGYQGGELNELSNYIVVRQSDAHAWTEVWLAERGWVRIDPTAYIAPQRVERGLDSAIGESELVPGRTLRRSPWLFQLRQNWDAVNTYWKVRIVNFDSEEQQAVMNLLGVKNADWRSLGTALLLAFIGFFIALMLWLGWRYRPTRHAPAVTSYLLLKKKLARIGIRAQQHEGPMDFLTRAAVAKPPLAPVLHELRNLYVALRYLPEPSPQVLARFRDLVRQLRV